jgi:hypothetical protein
VHVLERLELPRWLRGCVLSASPYAGPGPALVADCTVEGPAFGANRLLDELRAVLARVLGRLPGIVGYSVEGLAKRRYMVRKAVLADGGELRVVEEEGVLLNAAAVLPASAVPGEVLEEAASSGILVGEPLRPPVLVEVERPRIWQPLLTRPPVYMAEGGIPEHPGRLAVEKPDGSREEIPLSYIMEHAEPVEKPLHCVTGWSTSKLWRGVPLRRLVPLPRDAWVVAVSAAGYAATMPAAWLQDVLLVTGMDAEPLPPEHGGPLRLLAPSLYGWKSVKWLAEIHIAGSYVDGFWEARGYHERGLAEKEERFKNRNPEVLHEQPPPSEGGVDSRSR